jgi:YHS domain-containing protein
VIVRGIIYLVLIMIAIRILKGIGASLSGKDEVAAVSGEEMVKDPNCDTYIPKSDAIKKKVGGETCYFCSNKCLEEYRNKT